MRKRFWQIGAIVLSIALLISTAAGCAGEEVEKEKTIKIGVQPIFTGGAAPTTAPPSQGVIAYYKYVNDELGGIEYTHPDGYTEKVKLDIMWDDSGMSPPKVLTNYKRHKAWGAQLMSISCSTPLDTIARMVSTDKIPVTSMNGPATTFVISPIKPNYIIFSAPPHGDITAGALKWVAESKIGPQPPRVVLNVCDLPTVRHMADPDILAYAASLGIEEIYPEFISVSATDLEVQVRRSVEKGANWWVALNSQIPALSMRKDAKRLGVLDKFNWLDIQDGGFDENELKVCGELIEGHYGWVDNVLITEDIPEVKVIREAIRKYYNVDASLSTVHGWIQAIVTIEGLKRALERVGYENLTGEAIREAFYTIKDFDPKGLAGLVTITEKAPVVVTKGKVVQAQGGKLVPVTGWLDMPPVQLKR